MKSGKLAALVLAASLFCGSLVQASNFTDALEKIGRDAVQGYVGPGVTLLGAGANSGWYNSSKSYKFLVLPVGFSVATFAVPIMSIKEDMRSFDFEGRLPIKALIPNWDAIKNDISVQAAAAASGSTIPDEIDFKVDNVPTMFGSKKAKVESTQVFLAAMNTQVLNAMIASGMLPATVTLPFVGIDAPGILPSMPKIIAATVGVSKIPVVNNLQVGLTYAPPLTVPSLGKAGYLGLKLQHEITPHIPVFNKLPFIHLSAMYALNNMGMEAGLASLDFSNWIAQVNGSVDAKVPILGSAGAYVGLGLEGSKMDFTVPMAQYGLDKVDVTIKGDNKFRLTVGGRLSLFIFDIYADANFGSTTIYSAGITLLGLNGL